jgi:hypothetical protein
MKILLFLFLISLQAGAEDGMREKGQRAILEACEWW